MRKHLQLSRQWKCDASSEIEQEHFNVHWILCVHTHTHTQQGHNIPSMQIEYVSTRNRHIFHNTFIIIKFYLNLKHWNKNGHNNCTSTETISRICDDDFDEWKTEKKMKNHEWSAIILKPYFSSVSLCLLVIVTL